MYFLAVSPVFAMSTTCAGIGVQQWIDSTTGRHVVLVSPQPYATLPYFTANAISSDQQSMVYVSARGLHLIDLKTFATSLIVSATESELQCIEMGRKTNRLFYLSKGRSEDFVSLRSIDLNTRIVTEHAILPTGYRIESINSDETLAAGVREEPMLGRSPPITPSATKGEILYARVNAEIPMALFTVDLTNGAVHDVHRSTHWLSHPQFSPTDPHTLMYSHEGPWHEVDRIWMIRTDGRGRKLIHERTTPMEIAGHEFWSRDGRNIHYDWQRPKGQTFQLASYNITTGQRTSARLEREQWSIHFNSSTNPLVFVGDGADADQVSRSNSSAAIFFYRISPKGDSISSEKLVDLSVHDYSLEPNARLTPDNRWVIFRSNLFGVAAVFAVSVEPAQANVGQRVSTSVLAKRRQENRRDTLKMD